VAEYIRLVISAKTLPLTGTVRGLDAVNLLVYSRVVIASFRHKGLEELYLTGKTRRIGAGYVRKCIRIPQSLEVASSPEDMNVAGYRFHKLQGRSPNPVPAGIDLEDGPCA